MKAPCFPQLAFDLVPVYRPVELTFRYSEENLRWEISRVGVRQVDNLEGMKIKRGALFEELLDPSFF